MRPGFGQFAEASPEYLQFAAQYGATDVLLNLINVRGLGDRLDLAYLVKMRAAVEEWGLRLSAAGFDEEQARHLPLTHGREYSEEEMWANLEDWIRIITPVAEEEGRSSSARARSRRWPTTSTR